MSKISSQGSRDLFPRMWETKHETFSSLLPQKLSSHSYTCMYMTAHHFWWLSQNSEFKPTNNFSKLPFPPLQGRRMELPPVQAFVCSLSPQFSTTPTLHPSESIRNPWVLTAAHHTPAKGIHPSCLWFPLPSFTPRKASSLLVSLAKPY